MTEIDPDLIVYLDSSSSFLMSRRGVEIPEKKILSIAESIGVPVFGVGTRKMFKRKEFQDKFGEYVKLSADAEKTKKSNRVSGALFYNEKVDVLFCYIRYLQKKGAFDVVEAHTFMLYYDNEMFSSFSLEQLEEFIDTRCRRSNEGRDKANSASAALDKALQKKIHTNSGFRKSKRDIRVKTVSGTLGSVKTSNEEPQ